MSNVIDTLKTKCELAKKARIAARRRLDETKYQLQDAIERADGEDILDARQQLPGLHVELLQTAEQHNEVLKAFIVARNPPMEKAVSDAEAEVVTAKRNRAALDDEIKRLIAAADKEIARAEVIHREAAAIYRTALDEDVAENSAIQREIISASQKLAA